MRHLEFKFLYQVHYFANPRCCRLLVVSTFVINFEFYFFAFPAGGVIRCHIKSSTSIATEWASLLASTLVVFVTVHLSTDLWGIPMPCGREYISVLERLISLQSKNLLCFQYPTVVFVFFQIILLSANTIVQL